MDKRFFAVLFLILVLAVSCASRERTTTLRVTDDNPEVECIGEGKVLTVKVYGNPTTGYEWRAGESQEFKIKSTDYQASKAPSGMVGTGGYFVFVFEAVKSGVNEISFEYLRPWEDGKADSFSVRATVDSELTIKELEVL